MASTDFTDNVTVVPAAWLDDVDTAAYSYLTGVSGTDTITATGPASLSAYAAGQWFRFTPAGDNTGATTLAITGASALGAKNVYCGGAACVGGEIQSGVPCLVMYDGTQFNIMGPFNGGAVLGNIAGSGYIKSSSATAGIGYATGAGGTVTQGTSKSTGVTLSKVTGEITMHNAALAADTVVRFTLSNTAIAAGDHVVIQHVSGGTVGAYAVTAVAAAGSATVYVTNRSAGSLGEAIVLKFSVIKAVTA